MSITSFYYGCDLVGEYLRRIGEGSESLALFTKGEVEMSIKSIPEGYLVDIRPQGREGKRIRKRFKTKSEALQFERWVIATEHNKEWVERPADNRTLSELIELWWRYHGQTLKSGVNAITRLRKLDAALDYP